MFVPMKFRLFASALALSAVLSPTGGQATAMPAQTIAQADVQLPHISIRRIGSGSPVILIPGLSSPREVYAGVASRLAHDHSVYLVQVNGFGGDDPRANLRPGLLDGVVEDLHGYIATATLHDAAVVGHSMGGLIGLMLAKKHPGDLAKLMIVDSLPYVGDIFMPNATVAMLEPQARAMRDRMAASYGKPADEAAARATADGLALTPGARALATKWVMAADPRVSAAAMYEDMTTDLRPDMAAMTTPITLVYPYSEKLPKARADAFYRAEYAAAPQVTFVPVGDSAHFVMLDQPQAFAAALEDFLAA